MTQKPMLYVVVAVAGVAGGLGAFIGIAASRVLFSGEPATVVARQEQGDQEAAAPTLRAIDERLRALEGTPSFPELRLRTLEQFANRLSIDTQVQIDYTVGCLADGYSPRLEPLPRLPEPLVKYVPGKYSLFESIKGPRERVAVMLLRPDGTIEKVDGELPLDGTWRLTPAGLLLARDGMSITLDCASQRRCFLGERYQRSWKWRLFPTVDDDEYADCRRDPQDPGAPANEVPDEQDLLPQGQEGL